MTQGTRPLATVGMVLGVSRVLVALRNSQSRGMAAHGQRVRGGWAADGCTGRDQEGALGCNNRHFFFLPR
jgi:hypothetical protein